MIHVLVPEPFFNTGWAPMQGGIFVLHRLLAKGAAHLEHTLSWPAIPIYVRHLGCPQGLLKIELRENVFVSLKGYLRGTLLAATLTFGQERFPAPLFWKPTPGIHYVGTIDTVPVEYHEFPAEEKCGCDELTYTQEGTKVTLRVFNRHNETRDRARPVHVAEIHARKTLPLGLLETRDYRRTLFGTSGVGTYFFPSGVKMPFDIYEQFINKSFAQANFYFNMMRARIIEQRREEMSKEIRPIKK